MAFWVVGGHNSGSPLHDGSYAAGHQTDTRHANTNSGNQDDDYFNIQDRVKSHHYDTNANYDSDYRFASSEHQAQSVPVRNLAFLVIREGHDRHPSTPSSSPSSKPHISAEFSGPLHSRTGVPGPLERTESGLSISSDASAHHHCNSAEHEESLLEDVEAARLVRDHITSYRRRFPDSQPERILKALINPKSRGADFPLDNDALRSIFLASNELFFGSRLTRRVTWDWSHSASEQYENHIVGTTALRRSARLGGWETLIVLSSPILRDTKYNRRLLISTFLHEMIHSFMFVTCGLKAKQCGGHTDGFRQIAGIIDDWAGKECLHLRDMEADLSRWRGDDFSFGQDKHNIAHVQNVPHFEQENWNNPHRSNKHGEYLQPPLPRGQAAQEEWQFYEREDFGDRAQYDANLQYAP